MEHYIGLHITSQIPYSLLAVAEPTVYLNKI